MRKLAIYLFGLSMVLCLAGTAGAAAITFDVAGSPNSSVSVSENAGYATLTGSLASNLGSQVFTLDDNQTQTIDFFTLTASGFTFGASYSVTATLAFDAPPMDPTTGTGGGRVFTVGGLVSGGYLTWDPDSLPSVFDLGGTMISVNFQSGVAITGTSPVMVHAYITNHGAGTASAPVPEPGTMMLLGTGLLGLGLFGRRRNKG